MHTWALVNHVNHFCLRCSAVRAGRRVFLFCPYSPGLAVQCTSHHGFLQVCFVWICYPGFADDLFGWPNVHAILTPLNIPPCCSCGLPLLLSGRFSCPLCNPRWRLRAHVIFDSSLINHRAPSFGSPADLPKVVEKAPTGPCTLPMCTALSLRALAPVSHHATTLLGMRPVHTLLAQ